jgi:hypothetical protein
MGEARRKRKVIEKRRDSTNCIGSDVLIEYSSMFQSMELLVRWFAAAAKYHADNGNEVVDIRVHSQNTERGVVINLDMWCKKKSIIEPANRNLIISPNKESIGTINVK